MSRSPRHPHASTADAIAGFVHRHGWRAYALPVLTLATLVAFVGAGSGHHGAEAAAQRNPVGSRR